MRLLCPKCQHPIAASEVNLATDLAKCVSCGEIFKASDLVEDVDLSELKCPFGTRITFEAYTSDTGAFQIPPVQIGAYHVAMLLFALFWFGFIAYFTHAARANLAALVFTVPFWIAGILLCRNLINDVFERQWIDVTTDGLVIRKVRPFFPKQFELPYDRIDAILVETVAMDGWHVLRHRSVTYARMLRGWYAVETPCLVHGRRRTFFAETVSRAEMNWLVAVLRAIVFKLGGRKV